MKYVKGFKFNRTKIARLAGVESTRDPEVDVYIPIIKGMLNPAGYHYIALVWDHNVPRDASDGQLALVVVLDAGDEAEKLKEKPVEVDWSIQWAGAAFDGPDVWEVY